MALSAQQMGTTYPRLEFSRRERQGALVHDLARGERDLVVSSPDERAAYETDSGVARLEAMASLFYTERWSTERRRSYPVDATISAKTQTHRLGFYTFLRALAALRGGSRPAVGGPSELANRVLAAFSAATREAVVEHLKAGRSVTGVRGGRNIVVSPADIEDIRNRR